MSNNIFRTRIGRNRQQTVRAYSLFLTIYRQELDMGNKPNLKRLCERVKIGKVSASELPSDIATAPYEVVTSLEYAEKWLKETLRPLRTQRKHNTAAKKAAIENGQTPLGGIFELPEQSPADMVARLRGFIMNWAQRLDT